MLHLQNRQMCKNKKLYFILAGISFLTGFLATGVTCILFMEEAFFTMGALVAAFRTLFIYMLAIGILKRGRYLLYGVVGWLCLEIAVCFVWTDLIKIGFLLDDNLALFALFMAGYMFVSEE